MFGEKLWGGHQNADQQTSRVMIPVNEGNRNVLRSSKSHYNSNTQNPKCVTA